MPEMKWSVMTQFDVSSAALTQVDEVIARETTSVETVDSYVGTESYFHRDGEVCSRTIIRHFGSEDAALDWLSSSASSLHDLQLAGTLLGAPVHQLLSDPRGVQSSVTLTVAARRDDPDPAWQEQWDQRMSAALKAAPGFLGSHVRPPIPGVADEWVTVVGFDSQSNLDLWLSSETRAKLLAEADPHTHAVKVSQTGRAYAGWFAGLPAGQGAPPTWKMNAIILLVLFPLVTSLNLFLTPHLSFISRAGSIFITMLISVNLLGFFLVPWASRALSWWIRPTPAVARRRTLQGSALVIAIYVVTLLVATWLVNIVG